MPRAAGTERPQERQRRPADRHSLQGLDELTKGNASLARPRNTGSLSPPSGNSDVGRDGGPTNALQSLQFLPRTVTTVIHRHAPGSSPYCFAIALAFAAKNPGFLGKGAEW